MNHEAIYVLYPNVICIRDKTAFDENNQIVEYDEDLVNAKTAELIAQLEAKEQAAADAKQSALAKLMALGLTETEALALGVK